MTEQAYGGEELSLFARAENWKRYLAAEIGPYLGGRVLEVGAGIGGTTRALARGPREVRASGRTWLCLEPDPSNARRLEELIARAELPPGCSARCGLVRDLDRDDTFDTILYIDVLEHIEDDAAEMRDAAAHLAPGGHLVVLSPAHSWLFSPFDAAIGHHRRYEAAALRALAPGGVALVRLRYLDSVGLLASAANRVVLSQSVPTELEVLFWDRVMVRASRWIDPVLAYRVGKSVLGVWRRTP